MIVLDRNPGDYLVVLEDGVESYVELGAILGPRARSNKSSVADNVRRVALVTSLDPTCLFTIDGTWRAMWADAPVVAVIAPVAFMRSLRARGRSMYADDGDHDPLRDGQRGRF